VFVLYDYDSNHIFADPLPSRTARQIHNAYKRLLLRFECAGLKPQLIFLDNESKPNTTIFSLFLRINIVGMLPNVQSAPGRITSLPSYVQSTPAFPYICGIASFPKPISPSISFAALALTPNFPLTPKSSTISITIVPLSLRRHARPCS